MMRAPIDGPTFDPSLASKKADLHLHSNASHDVLNLPELSPRALYDKAVAQGMGFFTLTDHGTMRGIEALRRELHREFDGHPPIPVISGVELKIHDPRVGHTIHANVLGLSRHQMLELARRRRSVDRFLDFCRKEDLYHAYNHPFWFERGERATLETITELIDRFPIIELNAGRIPQLNRRTLAIARRFGRQVVATSDSHTGRVGRAYSMAPGETAEVFLQNLRAGASCVVPSSISFREFTEEIRETIDLVFLKQSAFRIKTSFLRENPLARRIARATLGSNLIMRPRPWKRAVGKAMQVIAYPPAYAYILRQRQMHWRLGEMEYPQFATQ
jgi:predicted metal-dependent phosphoesterase TrpH